MSEQRYHVYVVDLAKPHGPRKVFPGRLLASTDQDGLGVALVTLAAEGEFAGHSIGILDRPVGATRGTWIVNPYGANRTIPQMGDREDPATSRR